MTAEERARIEAAHVNSEGSAEPDVPPGGKAPGEVAGDGGKV